ncbi:CrpP-related protein [Rhizobium sp. Root1220]|uniref:CrpP-related protein n=1 Tax=Rhizobium sp. Root1220 TaxID=1736432 RepID=UPI0006FC9DC6|nr:CrpP-related protein [Rhizobium sp. Root1220]KQV70184.1 hypothetical protein ASC90_08605 [Rhizobium sp. Root1220]
MDIESLLAMQERGIRDRILGYQLYDNPMSRPELMPILNLEEWYAKFDAWRFGWSMEDASRKSARLASDRRRVATGAPGVHDHVARTGSASAI